MLRIRVSDAATGQPIPCRLHIKLADGSCWLPDETGDATYTEEEAPDLLLPSHFRRYLHICEKYDIRSIHLNHGEAELDVPAGKVTVHIARGHEYVPIVEQFEIGRGPASKEYCLERLIDMPARGWYSGDIHTHISRPRPEDDHVWLRLMAAEDLHAVNSLIFKHNGGVILAPQYAMGRGAERSRGGRVFASGEEFRDGNLYGHMIFAGISRVIEPISVGQMLAASDNYPLFATACDEAHAAGGIVGWAHGGGVFNRLYEALPIEAALGKVDFVEVIQFNMFFGYHFWRQLINCGIRLAAVGGSDFPFGVDMLAPWYPNLGLDRTYVQVDGDFTYAKWLDGIRAGRCFATNGPVIFLTVNGRLLGSEIALPSPGGGVTVEARALCAYPLDGLDILRNGGVVARVEGKGGQRELAFTGRIRVDDSSWIAAYAHGKVAPEVYGGVKPWHLYAHTSPVYALIAGKPIRVATDMASMADYVRLCMVRYVDGGYYQPGRFSTKEQIEELMANCRKALAYYESGM
ncbi:MAG: CehA/McbA family metallohydrolase [Planctomycetota bacterium]